MIGLCAVSAQAGLQRYDHGDGWSGSDRRDGWSQFNVDNCGSFEQERDGCGSFGCGEGDCRFWGGGEHDFGSFGGGDSDFGCDTRPECPTHVPQPATLLLLGLGSGGLGLISSRRK